MYPSPQPEAIRGHTIAMDMTRGAADQWLQTERAHVVGYMERGNYALRSFDNAAARPSSPMDRRPGRYNSSYGVHAAGFGIWSARLYAFLIAGVVPILFSDGVVLPFERVLRYEAGIVKLLSATYVADDRAPLEVLRDLDSDRRCADGGGGRLARMERAARSLGRWLDWHSVDSLRNPHTLVVLELLCLTNEAPNVSLCSSPTSRVAFAQLIPAALGPRTRPACGSKPRRRNR